MSATTLEKPKARSAAFTQDFASVAKSVYAGVGKEISNPFATANEVLQEAGLANWNLTPYPLLAEIGEQDGYGRPLQVRVPRRHAIVRGDTHQVIGVVGEHYRIFQNEDAFAWADEMVGDKGGCHWVAAGAARGGALVWMFMKTPFQLDLPDSPVETYLLMATGHDGGTPLCAQIIPTRLICMNQLPALLRLKGGHGAMGVKASASYRIRHSRNAEDKLAEAQRVLGLAKGAAENAAAKAEALFAQKLSDRQLDNLWEKLIPIREDAKPKTVENARELRATLRMIYRDEPTQQDIKGTAWGFVNAVAFHQDHGKKSRETTRSSAAENRMLASSFSRNLVDRALALVSK